MDLGLRGKRALMLAASMGLGRAAAEALAAERVELVISSSNAALWGISVEEAMRRRIENIPVGRFGELKEFGAVVAFLCSDCASYVNGSIIRVDGSQIKSIF